MLPSCMYGAVTATLRSVGGRNLPTSSGRFVNAWIPVLGAGYETGPARLYSPVLKNAATAVGLPSCLTSPLKFQPPWHWQHPPRCPEKKNASPRFADSEIALRSPRYR